MTEIKNVNTLANPTDSYRQWSEAHPFMATTAETLAMHVVKRGALWIGKKTGVHMGNAHAHHHVQGAEVSPALAASMAFGVEPVGEELGFRAGLIGKVGNKVGERTGRYLGIVSSLGFAASHAVDPIMDSSNWPHPDKSIYSKGNRLNTIAPIKDWRYTLPVGNFLGGLQYSRIYQKRGLKQAVFSHVLNNVLAVTTDGVKEARHMQQENPDAFLSLRAIARSAGQRKTARPGHGLFKQ